LFPWQQLPCRADHIHQRRQANIKHAIKHKYVDKHGWNNIIIGDSATVDIEEESLNFSLHTQRVRAKEAHHGQRRHPRPNES
jgi:hypothetical protein